MSTPKFQPGDTFVVGHNIQFIGNPYSYTTATKQAFCTVAVADDTHFATTEIDLSDYFSRLNNRTHLFFQRSQCDDSGYKGRMLHAVHDRDEILTLLDKACVAEQDTILERTQKRLDDIEQQLARLQAEKDELLTHGCKTTNGQHYARAFLEQNRQAFLERLAPSTPSANNVD